MRPSTPRLVLSLGLGLGLAACQATTVDPLGGSGPGTTIDPPVPLGPFTIEAFEGHSRGVSAYTSPVVVVDRQGRVHRAAIDADEDWPVFVLPNRNIRFPGDGQDAASLAMVQGPQGALHATWTARDRLWYARVEPATYTGEAVRVHTRNVHAPNLAVSNHGEVFIAYTDGWASRSPEMVLGAFRGDLESGFRGPEFINEGCCARYGRGVYQVTVGGVQFDDQDNVHLAYVTQLNGEGQLEYITDQGRGWTSVYRDANVLAGHRPGLLVTVDRVDLAFLRSSDRIDFATGPRYSRTGGLATETVHVGGEIRDLMLVRGPASRRHVVFDSVVQGRSGIEYIGLDTPERELVRVVEATGDRRVAITPRAGGLGWSPAGEMMLPYQDTPPLQRFGRSALAVGQPTGE